MTIKFLGSDLTIQGYKSALVAGSAFFGDHFYEVVYPLQATASLSADRSQHPASTKVQAPKYIRPGVDISFALVQGAIDYLHGAAISEKDIAKHSIPLILAAKAFRIFTLEERIRKHLTQKLDHQFDRITSEIQILELVPALRELYGNLSGGGGGDVEVGQEVAGIVTGAVAHACCRRFPMLKKSPEFMGLLKEVPVLAYDMLASDVEVLVATRNGDDFVEREETVDSGGGSTEVVAQEVVTEVVEEVGEETMEEVIEEAVQAVKE